MKERRRQKGEVVVAQKQQAQPVQAGEGPVGEARESIAVQAKFREVRDVQIIVKGAVGHG